MGKRIDRAQSRSVFLEGVTYPGRLLVTIDRLAHLAFVRDRPRDGDPLGVSIGETDVDLELVQRKEDVLARKTFPKARVTHHFQTETRDALELGREPQGENVFVRVGSGGENRQVVQELENGAVPRIQRRWSRRHPIQNAPSERCLPCRLLSFERGRRSSQRALQRRNPRVQAVERRRRVFVRQQQKRIPLAPTDIDILFLNVGEESRHAVEVLRAERVELVVVALGASNGRAHPDRSHCPHPVRVVLRTILLGLGAALGAYLVQTIESRRDLLARRRVRQQVAGELLARERVEGKVLVERAMM